MWGLRSLSIHAAGTFLYNKHTCLIELLLADNHQFCAWTLVRNILLLSACLLGWCFSLVNRFHFGPSFKNVSRRCQYRSFLVSYPIRMLNKISNASHQIRPNIRPNIRYSTILHRSQSEFFPGQTIQFYCKWNIYFLSTETLSANRNAARMCSLKPKFDTFIKKLVWMSETDRSYYQQQISFFVVAILQFSVENFFHRFMHSLPILQAFIVQM